MLLANSEAVSARRSFLTKTVAGAFGLLVGCRAEQTKRPSAGNTQPHWIDAHIHLWTPDTKQFPLAPWAKSSDLQPPSFTAEEYLQLARPAGIQRAVLVQHAPLYGYDSSYLHDCCARFPEVFALIGMIDERLPKLEERLRKQRESGLRGLRINPTIHADRTPVSDPANWLNVPEMRQLWKCAAEQDLAVCPLMTADLLPTLDPMCGEFPQTKCVIDHMGRVALKNETQIAELLRLSRHPNVYVKVSAFYQFGERLPPYLELSPLIQQLNDSFGADRLLWGSDCPYQLKAGHTLDDSVKLIESRLSFLAASDRQKILHDTAESLFFL